MLDGAHAAGVCRRANRAGGRGTGTGTGTGSRPSSNAGGGASRGAGAPGSAGPGTARRPRRGRSRSIRPAPAPEPLHTHRTVPAGVRPRLGRGARGAALPRRRHAVERQLADDGEGLRRRARRTGAATCGHGADGGASRPGRGRLGCRALCRADRPRRAARAHAGQGAAGGPARAQCAPAHASMVRRRRHRAHRGPGQRFLGHG